MNNLVLDNTIQKINQAINNSHSEYSYYEILAAVLVMKGFTLGDCKTIASKNMLMCNYHDMNICIAYKNHLQLFDLDVLNNNENLKDVATGKETDESLSVLYKEVEEVLKVSKEIVEEIQYVDGYIGFLKEFDSNSILKFFDEDVQTKIKKIIETSFDIFRFNYSVDLKFTRKDNTQFIFNAELAARMEEVSKGLSGRPYIPDDAGMWYEFDEEMQIGFVTKEVSRSLSVAYINKDDVIIEIIDRVADDSKPYYCETPFMHVLEVPKGWFNRNKVMAGDKVRMKTIIDPFS